MSNQRLLRILFFIFLVATAIAFYLGLRSDDRDQQIFYTVLSLPGWGITYLINRRMKKLERETEDEGHE